MSEPTATSAPPEPMSRRETLEALSGLLLVLFVSMLSVTIVSVALPQIVGSLNGTYLNRERIDESVLHTGDEVQIGKFRLVFYAGRPES